MKHLNCFLAQSFALKGIISLILRDYFHVIRKNLKIDCTQAFSALSMVFRDQDATRKL